MNRGGILGWMLIAALPVMGARSRPEPVLSLDGFQALTRRVVVVEGAFSVTVPNGATAYRPVHAAHDNGVAILLPSGGLIAVSRAPGDAEFGEDVPCNEHIHQREDGSPGIRTQTTLAGQPACDLALEGPAIHREMVEQVPPGSSEIVSLVFITRNADVLGDRVAFDEIRSTLVLARTTSLRK